MASETLVKRKKKHRKIWENRFSSSWLVLFAEREDLQLYNIIHSVHGSHQDDTSTNGLYPRQPTLYSFHKYLLSTYNMPDIVLRTGKVAVGSFHGRDMKQISRQWLEAAILIWVMRKCLSEEKTFTEFQERVSHVTTWENGVLGIFPLEGTEAETSWVCSRCRMRGSEVKGVNNGGLRWGWV